MTATVSTTNLTAIPQPAPYQHHAYRKSGQSSPTAINMSNAPNNVSPTSPRTSQIILPRHQGIYQPRCAIGVPAALRKTEKPGGKSPSPVDSAMPSPNTMRFSTSLHGQAGHDGSLPPITTVGHADMLSLSSDVPLSPVAGPITRNHWQADSSTSICSASSCHEPFGFFQRRHHCRKCGGIFCWQHSSKQVRLDELARFHPHGILHRACDRCHGSFREWEHLRLSRNNSESSSSSVVAIDTPATPVTAKRPENPRVGSIAQSLQGAWNWSTF